MTTNEQKETKRTAEKSVWKKINRAVLGLLVTSGTVISALPISEAFACDPNNPNCANNPGYTGSAITNPDKSKTVYFKNVNWQRIRLAPGSKLLFGLQMLSEVYRITDYDAGQVTYWVKDDRGTYGLMTCTSDYISLQDNCTASLNPWLPSQNPLENKLKKYVILILW